MDVFEKSLQALETYLNNTPAEEINEIIKELSKKMYEGPTIAELFPRAFHDDPKFFESHSVSKKKL